MRTKESSRAFFLRSLPSPDAETCYFFHKLLRNCLDAALIITKYVTVFGPPFALFISQSIALWSKREVRGAWSCVYVHSLLYWYFFPLVGALRSHDLSQNACFYGCAQVTFTTTRDLPLICERINCEKERKWRKPTFAWCLRSSPEKPPFDVFGKAPTRLRNLKCLMACNYGRIFDNSPFEKYPQGLPLRRKILFSLEINSSFPCNFPIFHLLPKLVRINYPWIRFEIIIGYQSTLESLQRESGDPSFCLRFYVSFAFKIHQVPAKICRGWKM